ncbi:MAG: pseudouridine-5'-phosphate glycosidase [Cryobacterium sp.]|nr:pseudouridine-5'-phosphate glycosidase [Cryobacterium sp.]
MILSTAIRVSEAVREAVADGTPLVALESTIFTHGLPRPINLEVALEAEELVRSHGAVPATIGVLDGVPTIGLTRDEIQRLSAIDEVVKVSQRDLSIAVVKGLSGGTTVAATAFLAHSARIRVFATGGLGGVHRGAAESFDESADLVTLAEIPVLVVSAGVKSILDIPATLERLETLNITVAGYRTTRYPGFYVADSGFTVEHSVSSPEEAASILRTQDELGLCSAVLIANPIDEASQLAPETHSRVLAAALQAAESAGVAGNATTPFLLEYMQRATEGESLRVNVDVYRGNVVLGAEIATALSAPR